MASPCSETVAVRCSWLGVDVDLTVKRVIQVVVVRGDRGMNLEDQIAVSAQ
jgi:hypothetical protein